MEKERTMHFFKCNCNVFVCLFKVDKKETSDKCHHNVDNTLFIRVFFSQNSKAVKIVFDAVYTRHEKRNEYIDTHLKNRNSISCSPISRIIIFRQSTNTLYRRQSVFDCRHFWCLLYLSYAVAIFFSLLL